MTETFYQHLLSALEDIRKRKDTASRHMKELHEVEETDAEQDAIFNERHGEYYALYYCEDRLKELAACARIYLTTPPQGE